MANKNIYFSIQVVFKLEDDEATIIESLNSHVNYYLKSFKKLESVGTNGKLTVLATKYQEGQKEKGVNS